ncbi:acetyltransferase [Candidatus Raskinella chloraquaticus]|jgi:sugar O-acyltransferase (sialic acid O-acetyltransferase NeuD family)|uniref:PglD N-terminal domain-containing protein n=1 Tax=Candidatus Raskinella chloraquaticus TaxID=1951219 RepID=A0A1W9HPQ4_9HYPH|nr:MAG: hypothetical protein A4S15_01345 [Proteobacteria bacterium SG_bin8]
MRRIYIFGCGGSGREILQIVLDLAEAGEQIEPAAFLVDSVFEAPTHVQGLQIFRSLDAPHQDPTAQVVIGLGSPAARKCVARRLEKLGIRCATLIHPRAWIGREVFFGPGVVVCAQAAVVTNVRLGAHVHVNVASSVHHDCRLDDFATLAPGVHLAGHVTLEEGADLGIGACAIPGVTIGRWASVGAGAVVTRDVAPNSVAVGVPAREIRRRREGWHEDRWPEETGQQG